MKTLRTFLTLLFILQICVVPLAKTLIITKQITKTDTLKVRVIKPDPVIYNDSIDSITMQHYKGLLDTIDRYYRHKSSPGFVYRYIPLFLFPRFCYKNELLPDDKPIIYFDNFRYNLMQIKLTQFGGELVAIATVSYVKFKNKQPKVMTYRLNFYEYSAITDEWKKSEYTTSIDFFLIKDGCYSNHF